MSNSYVQLFNDINDDRKKHINQFIKSIRLCVYDMDRNMEANFYFSAYVMIII